MRSLEDLARACLRALDERLNEANCHTDALQRSSHNGAGDLREIHDIKKPLLTLKFESKRFQGQKRTCSAIALNF